jgi:hypothetical protein
MTFSIFFVKQFFGSFSFRFDCFASVRLFPDRFCCRLLRFRFDAKQTKNYLVFASTETKFSFFASEPKTAAHPQQTPESGLLGTALKICFSSSTDLFSI